MPRTTEQNKEIKEVTDLKIKDAALKLFSHKGLATTSISDISKQAGISTGLMYHYYKSKEELYAELIGLAIKDANAVFDNILKKDISPTNKIKQIVWNILSDLEKDNRTPMFFVLITQALMNNNLPDKAKEYMKDVYVSFDLMVQIIQEGQDSGEIKEGEAEMLSTVFLSSLNGLCTYKLILDKHFIIPSLDILTSLLIK